MYCRWWLVICVSLAVLGFSASVASAHFLWVTIESQDGTPGRAIVVFEEGPRAGDGGYLDPFVDGCQTWMRTLDSEGVSDIELSEVNQSGKRWLAGPLPAQGPRSIESYGKFGVYRYGDTDALLHYYAKYLEVRTGDELRALGRATKLALDMVPQATQGTVELQLLWRGEPAAETSVYVRGPEGQRQTLTTDAAGIVR